MRFQAAIITVSDKGSRGEREDTSGPAVAAALSQMGATVTEQCIIPDEPDQITETLVRMADSGLIDLIITTGGTGPAPRDLTPEATLAAIDRQMPGIAELLRLKGYEQTPRAVLSRGVSGLRGSCLIINLPGSRRAVQEGMQTLGPVLVHALQMAQGVNLEHGQDEHNHA